LPNSEISDGLVDIGIKGKDGVFTAGEVNRKEKCCGVNYREDITRGSVGKQEKIGAHQGYQDTNERH